MLEILLIALAATEAFYLLFLVYAAYDNARESGVHIRKATLWMIGPPLALGYLLDVAWNCTLGSLMFAEVPWSDGGHPLKWTFTARLKRHSHKLDWRGTQARFWASYLNPFDASHVD